MCAAALLSLAMQMGVSHALLPDPDLSGRFPTLNRMGKVDPTLNEIQRDFLKWGEEHARKAPAGSPISQQGYLMELGMGYGFVAQEAVRRGLFYIGNDLSDEHVEIAKQLMPEPIYDSQFEFLGGRFPSAEVSPGLFQGYKISGVLLSHWLHWYTADEIREILDGVWDLLEEGGRAYLTAGTAWNGLIPRHWVNYYNEKKKRFLRRPDLQRYPGEFYFAWMFLPQKHYPPFYHALDYDVLEHLAQRNPQKRFQVVKKTAIQRPDPPEQRYPWQGYRFGHTEVHGIVLEKPRKQN